MTDNGLLPIPRPGKIVCVGLNYRDHASESAMELPAAPLLFAKWPNGLVGPGEPIVLPHQTTEVDYEAELGVVIGRAARSISADDALDHVAGYLCANDVSARDIQFGDGQWTRGKSFDTFCPVGPMVPAAQIADPQNLRIRCLLNGEAIQDGTTADMIFGVAEVIAYVSDGIALEPGDLILTGTPPGVGFVRNPPVFLQDGDEVTVEIEGVGTPRRTRSAARERGARVARTALRDRFGADVVADGVPAFYLTDATEARGLSGHADALALPRTAEEVAEVVAWCYEQGVPITPRGGGTGFAGGAVPHGGVVLGLERVRAGPVARAAPLADGGRGRRDDRRRAQGRARERAPLPARSRAPPSSRRSAGTSPRTRAARTPSSTASPATG